jgi:hypothetical protein
MAWLWQACRERLSPPLQTELRAARSYPSKGVLRKKEIRVRSLLSFNHERHEKHEIDVRRFLTRSCRSCVSWLTMLERKPGQEAFNTAIRYLPFVIPAQAGI